MNSNCNNELLTMIRSSLRLPNNKDNGKEDVLLELEKMDNNFHRYTYIKNLQKKVGSIISDLLRKELDSQQINDPNMVPLLVEKIMSSPQYQNLLKVELDEAKKTVSDYKLDDSTDIKPNKIEPESCEGSLTSGSFKVAPGLYSTFSNNSNNPNSDSPFSLTLSPGFEDIKLIAANVHSRNTVEVRLSAIQKFNSFSSADLLCSELWPQTRGILDTTLSDLDSRIVTISLRILSRIFRSAPPNMAGEVYLSIATSLANSFENGQISRSITVLNVDEVKSGTLLKKFRILNQFQLEMPSFWCRFNEQLHREVMNTSFRLLKSSETRYPGSITAFQCLAVIDPKALWFKKWMLSNFGRYNSLSSIVKVDLITELVYNFISFCSILDLKGDDCIKLSSKKNDQTSASKQKDSRATDEVLVLDVELIEENEFSSKKISQFDLEYLQFLHSIVMLSKLAQFGGGRNLFPIKISKKLFISWNQNNRKFNFNLLEATSDPDYYELSLNGFMKLLIKLLCFSPKSVTNGSIPTQSIFCQSEVETPLNLSRYICKLLKDIASADLKCRKNLYLNDLMSELILPLKLILSGKDLDDEVVLLNIAETLSHIVAKDSGRKFILRGTDFENEKRIFFEAHTKPIELTSMDLEESYNNESNLLRIVATFVKKNLEERHYEKKEGSLEEKVFKPIPLNILGSFIYFLRQIYCTCEGLLRLEGYNLHNALVGSNKKNSQGVTLNSSKNLSEWDIIVLDNLLNFCGTPKGILLLQKSGSMKPCVDYMFFRYEKKLQVSKCEKFGYGVLVSQVSSTSPGMIALYETHLIRSFLEDLWVVLEGDENQGDPNMENLTPGKIINNIFKVFSNFQGLNRVVERDFENLKKIEGFFQDAEIKDLKKKSKEDFLIKKMDKKPDYRNTLSYIILKVVMFDNRLKDDNFTALDDSHGIGLQILKLFCSSLDSFILIQTKFKFLETLFYLQKKQKLSNSEYIIDDNTLLRNLIIISTSSVGGYSEKETENYDFENFVTTLNLKIFDNKQCLSDIKLPDISMEFEADSYTFDKIIDISEDSLTKIEKIKNYFFGKELWQNFESNLTLDFVSFILKYSLDTASKFSTENAKKLGWECIQNRKNKKSNEVKVFTEFEELGLDLAINYASRILKIKELSVIKKKLKEVLNAVNFEKAMDEEFSGFDWFTVIIFIIFNGNTNETIEFLTKFENYLPSLYLWPTCSLNVTKRNSGITLLFSTSIHLVEAIMEEELPLVSSAFILSGCTPSQVAERWLREVFLNVLNFKEISLYLTILFSFGVDYQIYFVILILKKLEKLILKSMRKFNLIDFFQNSNLNKNFSKLFKSHNESKKDKNENFLFNETNLKYLQHLESKYRSFVLSEMSEAVKIN